MFACWLFLWATEATQQKQWPQPQLAVSVTAALECFCAVLNPSNDLMGTWNSDWGRWVSRCYICYSLFADSLLSCPWYRSQVSHRTHHCFTHHGDNCLCRTLPVDVNIGVVKLGLLRGPYIIQLFWREQCSNNDNQDSIGNYIFISTYRLFDGVIL